MERSFQLATDSPGMMDAYGQFVTVADETVGRALNAQCLSPQRLRLLEDIRKRLVARLCSEEFRGEVERITDGLAAAARRRLLDRLRDFIGHAHEPHADTVWPRLDAAREILRDWLLCVESDAPIEALATLTRFDMLLRGGNGEPDELWWSLVARSSLAGAKR